MIAAATVINILGELEALQYIPQCLLPPVNEALCQCRIDLLLRLLALVVGASPWVPPGLAFGEGQVWEEGSEGSFYLVWFAAQSVLSRAVV